MIFDFLDLVIKFLRFIFITIPLSIWKFINSIYEFLFISNRKYKRKSIYAKFFDHRKRKNEI